MCGGLPCGGAETADLPPCGGDVAEGDRGVAARGAPASSLVAKDVGDLGETTPSGLPAISPSRGEIERVSAFANLPPRSSSLSPPAPPPQRT
ncbi:MAG: hypothetical protein EOQ47_30685 [Mesorhizobium sp.]|nr:MAG: hypothetical protein EOQ47_30685 [Mesorhizobium sp.]